MPRRLGPTLPDRACVTGNAIARGRVPVKWFGRYATGMHRRSLVLSAPALLILSRVNRAQAARSAPLAPRRLALRHATTGARFAGIYHDGRAVDLAALAEISQVLADSRTGTVQAYDPGVLDILWETGQRARQTGEFLVVSGFRTPETNAAVCGAGNSQHLRASALDVCIGATRLTGFADSALSLRRGGVGLYAAKGFVHLDSGPVRRWGWGEEAAGGNSHTAAPKEPARITRMAPARAAMRPR